MRVLVLHNNFPTAADPQVIGGAETSVDLLSNELAAVAGNEVLIVRGIAPGRQPYLEEPREGWRMAALPISRPYWVYDGKPHSAPAKAYWHYKDDLGEHPKQLEKLVREFDPAIALFHNVSGIGWRSAEVLNALNVPIIQTLHDYFYICPRMTRFRNGRRCEKTCSSCAFFTRKRRRAEDCLNAVVAVSSAVLKSFDDAGMFTQVERRLVIHNAVDIPPRHFERNWPELRLGFLGRFSPEKGLDLLASAFAGLPADARLLVAGPVPPADQQALRALAGRDIQFLGFVPPEDLLSRIDVLVIPSLWEEPFGRVAIEAQAFGVPCIVSDRGGLPDTISHGEAGWIFEPSAPGALAGLLSKIASDKTLIDAKRSAIAGVLPNFSVAKYVDGYRTLISELTGR